MTETRLVAWADADALAADELGRRLDNESATHIVWIDRTARATGDAVPALTAALERFPAALAYADGRDDGGRSVHRPSFSPVRLRSGDYLGPLRVFETRALRAIGGFRPAADGSHGFDLALRLIAAGEKVLHVPAELSSGPGVTAGATEVDVAVVREHLATIGSSGIVSIAGDRLHIDYPPRGRPLVSIVIPTRGGRAVIRGRESTLVVDAVRGILNRSRYEAIEFVVVADAATPAEVLAELRDLPADLRIVPWEGPFNFSAKINRGMVHSRGEYLLLLNDDVEVITGDFIEVLLGLAQEPGVGIVGPMLYFEDGTVQHGGHVYRDGSAGHAAFRWPRERDDLTGSLRVDREVSGVTAACAMVSRQTFERVGGMSALFPGNYNDVDFCLKIRSLGLSAVWTPRAELFHFESKSRVATISPSELAQLRHRWNPRIQVEAFSPAL